MRWFFTVGVVAFLSSAAPSAHAIIKGTASSAEQDFVVQLAYTEAGGRVAHCTGTVVAKRLVLTARHCVGEVSADDSTVTDFKAEKLQILTGRDASKRVLGTAAANAKGAKLFVPKTSSLIPDIAVILTDTDLDTPIAQLRLGSGVAKNESIDLVGYGLTEDGTYPPARLQRTGVKVFALGPSESRFFDVAQGEYVLGEAACSGDSGGPAIASQTGAVVGVASRVANGKDPKSIPPSLFCLGDVVEDVYGDLTLAKPLLDQAFAETGDQPWIEGQDPPKPKTESSSSSSGSAPAESGCTATREPPQAGALGLVALSLLAISRKLRRRAPRNSRAPSQRTAKASRIAVWRRRRCPSTEIR